LEKIDRLTFADIMSECFDINESFPVRWLVDLRCWRKASYVVAGIVCGGKRMSRREGCS